jgi:uncharacterized protein (TIGR02145 family)
MVRLLDLLKSRALVFCLFSITCLISNLYIAQANNISASENDITGEWINTKTKSCTVLQRDGNNYKVTYCNENFDDDRYVKTGLNSFESSWDSVKYFLYVIDANHITISNKNDANPEINWVRKGSEINEIVVENTSETKKNNTDAKNLPLKLTQTWSKANSCLKTDFEGIELNYAENINQWKTFCDKDQPTYCYYKFNEKDSSLGLIYNYSAVRVIAPEGYRVPSKKEFELLLKELKKSKQTNTLCSIIPTSVCNICISCTSNDYDTQLNFNLKPFGWLSVSKSKKDKWKENGEDMYLWTMETERKNSLLSGLGLAQFKSPSTIKTVDLNEINNVGAKGENVKNKDDFEFIEKYYGTFVRFIKK